MQSKKIKTEIKNQSAVKPTDFIKRLIKSLFLRPLYKTFLKEEEIDEGKRTLAVQTDPEAVLSTASGEVCAEQKI